MEQSREREAELLKQYDPYIQRQVCNYLQRGGHQDSADREDFLQEARLEFLRHIRRIPDDSTLLLCKYNIFGALCAYSRAMAIIRIPKYCFKDQIQKVSRVDYDGALKELEEQDASASNMDLLVEIRDFEASLPKDERQVFQMKLEGFSSREIIPCVGVAGEPQMSRLLHCVKDKAIAYFGQQRKEHP